MKSVIVMPTFKRTEFLALALENISKADAAPDDVRIFLDHTTETQLNEVEYVRDTYCPNANIFHAQEHVKAPSGCWNILHAMKAGYESGADIIFSIEEDVMIYPDYFTWSFEALNSGCFAACGRFIKRYGDNYYTNPGASFKRENLGLVIPHINDEFFADRRGYMDRTFGPMAEASDLDDGLIRRVIRQSGGCVKFPETPKVAHQGFHFFGKCEVWRTTGKIQERIEQLRTICSNIDPTNRYTQDFEPFGS